MKTRYKVFIASVGLLLLVFTGGFYLFASRGSKAAETVTPSNCGRWHLIQSVNNSSGPNYFLAVSASSSHDVWAVGSAGTPAQGLAEHWNGNRWERVSTPIPPHSSANSFNGVAAITSNDVWAAGVIYMPDGTSQALLEYWDGSRWNIVAHPEPQAQYAQFTGIHAISASNVWAVGSLVKRGSGSAITLIEHWNGSQWSMVASPNLEGDGFVLDSITGFSANDLWAVGLYHMPGSQFYQPLVEHWNGSAWKVIPAPTEQSWNVELAGVSGVTGNDVWAVGFAINETGSEFRTVVERWNGLRWSIVSSPNPGTANMLWGVVALSSHNVWAVGATSNSSGTKPQLIEHWDGVQWRSVASPNPQPLLNSLTAVINVPGTSEVWAVGNHFTNGQSNAPRTYTEFYC